MSYDVFESRGTTFYLCWNCGRIHVERIETQQCKEDHDFIEKCLNKRRNSQVLKSE